jgi:beta-N-acetylhexosaminidase
MTVDFGLRFIVEPTAPVLSSEEAELLRELRPAGVMFRSRNFVQNVPYPEWRALFAKLLSDVRTAIGREKIVVSIDHEGGRVHRFPAPVTRFPYPAFYGQSLEAVESVSRAMATELRSLGFNLSCSPCADIHSNSENPVINQRAFGVTAHAVSEGALRCARTLRKEGIMPCAKHFPGHGDTGTDSHYSLPVLNRSREELYDREFVPFKALIDDGIEMIMTAHIVVPQLDEARQATISPVLLRSILREELGFRGVTVADALGMQAIRDDVSSADFATRAHQAGLDLFLFVGDPVSIKDAISTRDALKVTHAAGHISTESLLEVEGRVNAFVATLGQYPVVELSADTFAEHARLAESLTHNAPFSPFHFEPKGFD